MNYHIGRLVLSFVVCWSFWCGRFLVVFILQAEASACKTNTTTNTTDVVIHQQSRKLLKMDILMSETC